jgi:hypothetical protein
VSAERDLLSAEASGAVFTSGLMTHISISDVTAVDTDSNAVQASTPVNGAANVSFAVVATYTAAASL